jgi:hypothetical protein
MQIRVSKLSVICTALSRVKVTESVSNIFSELYLYLDEVKLNVAVFIDDVTGS